jgi:membrane protein implicated in regulation of membrane protease activity
MARASGSSERAIPAHPYRDSAVVYAGLAILIVALAAVTGGDVVRAALVAVVFFLVATAWSWWRFRVRIGARAAAATAAEQDLGDHDGSGAGGGNE